MENNQPAPQIHASFQRGNTNPECFFQALAYGFDCYPGLSDAVPDGGVNRAKISLVDLQHIKLAPAMQFSARTIYSSLMLPPIRLIEVLQLQLRKYRTLDPAV
jgi:hypothetical protein